MLSLNKYDMAVQTIKSSVSALDVAGALGLEVRHGRCQCPIHGGQDFNCRLYPGNRGYMCWVCKSAGDVIKFVREYYGMNFKDSVAWFRDTFNLPLDLEGKIDPEKQRQAEIALKMRKRAIAIREWKERTQFGLFLMADEILRRLENQRDRNVPTKADEPWNREFTDAVRLIPTARMFAEKCYAMCMKEKDE